MSTSNRAASTPLKIGAPDTGIAGRTEHSSAPLPNCLFLPPGNRFPSHEMGMVGLLKQLIDESALSDIFHSRFGMPRTRSSWIRSMHICTGLVIIEKAWESTDGEK